MSCRPFSAVALLLVVVGTTLAAEYYADTETLTAESEAIDDMKAAEVRFHLRRLDVPAECPECETKAQYRQKLRDALAAGHKVVKDPNEASPRPPPASKEASEAAYDAIRKKKEENDRIRDALRKAGYDASSFSSPEDKIAEMMEQQRRGGKAGGAKPAKKGKTAQEAQEPAKEAPPPPPTEPTDIEGDL